MLEGAVKLFSSRHGLNTRGLGSTLNASSASTDDLEPFWEAHGLTNFPIFFRLQRTVFFPTPISQDNFNDCRKPEAEGLFWVPFASIHGIHHLYHSRPQSSSSRTLWITFFVKGSQQRFGASDKVHTLQDELGGFNPEYLTKNHCGSNKNVCDQPPKVPV